MDLLGGHARIPAAALASSFYTTTLEPFLADLTAALLLHQPADPAAFALAYCSSATWEGVARTSDAFDEESADAFVGVAAALCTSLAEALLQLSPLPVDVGAAARPLLAPAGPIAAAAAAAAAEAAGAAPASRGPLSVRRLVTKTAAALQAEGLAMAATALATHGGAGKERDPAVDPAAFEAYLAATAGGMSTE